MTEQEELEAAVQALRKRAEEAESLADWLRMQTCYTIPERGALHIARIVNSGRF